MCIDLYSRNTLYRHICIYVYICTYIHICIHMYIYTYYIHRIIFISKFHSPSWPPRSDYHPETWQPAWSVATVLKGLLSFMCEARSIPTNRELKNGGVQKTWGYPKIVGLSYGNSHSKGWFGDILGKPQMDWKVVTIVTVEFGPSSYVRSIFFLEEIIVIYKPFVRKVPHLLVDFVPDDGFVAKSVWHVMIVVISWCLMSSSCNQTLQFSIPCWWWEDRHRWIAHVHVWECITLMVSLPTRMDISSTYIPQLVRVVYIYNE